LNAEGLHVKLWQQFSVVIVVLLAFQPASAAGADNWPQWRGPLGTGVAEDSDPPTTWSQTSRIKWKVPVPGEGTSTPIIWGERVFVLTAYPGE
jgi:outer membrane protein assembly factor BamB